MARTKILDTCEKPNYVRFDKSLKKVLDEIGFRERRAMNGMVNLAVKEWLERHYPEMMLLKVEY